MIEVDPKRTIIAKPFDWKEANYPEYGNPGESCNVCADHLTFACPGCGRFGSIAVGNPKPPAPGWEIMKGELSDPTSLTLSPSIHCVGCCNWHGHLINGIYIACS